MKLREKIKRFWTLDVHNHEGFTLVELIIVIAILAILSSVAVVGYSSYVTKTNKQADLTLAAEVQNALLLAYYSGEITESGYVVLSMDKEANPSNDEVRSALLASFGNLSNMKLKYKWQGNAGNVVKAYQGSGFEGKEENLMADVQSLTDALKQFETDAGGFISEYLGDSYQNFAKEYGIDVNDATQVSNSATVYVAEISKKLDKTAFINAWVYGNPDGSSAQWSSKNFNSMLNVMGCYAAHYARMESLAIYIDSQKKDINYNGYTSATAWLRDQKIYDSANPAQVNDVLDGLIVGLYGCAGNDQSIFDSYETQAKKDAEAYLAMMGAISDNADVILEGVNDKGMYTDGDMEKLLQDYMAVAQMMGTEEGTIAIVFSVSENGYTMAVVGADKG